MPASVYGQLILICSRGYWVTENFRTSELPGRTEGLSFSCKVYECEFSKKSDLAVLNRTGPPTRAVHGANRLTRTSCPLSPCLSTLFKKISTPSDRHRGMTFRPPWAFCVLGLCKKLSCEILNSLQITHKKLNMGL